MEYQSSVGDVESPFLFSALRPSYLAGEGNLAPRHNVMMPHGSDTITLMMPCGGIPVFDQNSLV